MIGSRIGDYRVIKLLGEGGMGAVYEAVNDTIERRVAIKILDADYARKPEPVARFFNEARAANIIDHPSVVQISAFAQLPDGTPYIVMELLEGETLSQRLTRSTGGRLPLKEAIRIAWQVASALATAHAKGIVHRDLKPSNLMLVSDSLVSGGERVKVLDFGIAKLAADTRPGKTASQVVMGTPTYMSPEQCRGAGAVDDKTDVYALGVLLFEMLAARPPFVSEGSGELIGMHLFKPAPLLRELAPTVPTEIAAFVDQMLAKEKEQRPSMQGVAQHLGKLLETGSLVADSNSKQSEQTESAPRPSSDAITPPVIDEDTSSAVDIKRNESRSTWLKRGVAGMIALLLGTGGIVVFRRATSPIPPSVQKTQEPTAVTTTSSPSTVHEQPSVVSIAVPDMSTKEQSAPPTTAQVIARFPASPPRPIVRPPAQPRLPLSPNEVENALSQAQAAYVQGKFDKAVQLARLAQTGSPVRAWRIIGAVACAVKNLVLADDAYRRLDAHGQQYLIYICQRNAVRFAGEHFQRAGG